MGDCSGLDAGPSDARGRMQPRQPQQPQQPRRILFLDAYDSFTNNIVSLLKGALGDHVTVHVLHMDLRTLDADPQPAWTRREFLDRLAGFDAVVCGPGPGSPLHDADVGAFKLLWELPRERAVPVLGICLGFQSLVAHFGGGIRRLRRGLHGMVRDIDHVRGPSADIFDGVPRFRATLYHSLCADVGQDAVPEAQWRAARWASPAGAPDLVPLAWTLEKGDDEAQGDERSLMAVRHASRPFWGVQYHPESVCTESAAHGVIENWFRQALKWNEATRREVDRSVEYADSLDPANHTLPGLSADGDLTTCSWWRDMQSGLARTGLAPGYACRQIKLPDGVDTAEVAEVLGLGAADSIILDSSSTVNGDPLARNSILALDVQAALRAEYRVGDDYVTLRQPATPGRGEKCQRIALGNGEHDPWTPWHVISEFWRLRRAPDNGQPSPTFKGGFMGFVTYEMGLSTLSPGLVSGDRGHRRPDICMAWVSRSVVLDHQAGVAYVQALTAGESDGAWIDDVVEMLQSSHAWRHPGCSSADINVGGKRANEALLQHVQKDGGRLRFSVPNSNRYEEDVGRCQDAIRDGESYELCLTAQTTMTRPPGIDLPRYARPHLNGDSTRTPEQSPKPTAPLDEASSHGTPWHIFRTLRARQPAPFGSFIRLGGATIISSSPERFLTHDPQGLCSMRPMKGTVRKSDAVSTLAEAERILHVPKEEAENLMIVDLVRHDLHGVCGTGSVTVPDLLRVEEYASVFQMITVVNGQLPGAKLRSGTQPSRTELPFTGMDVLASALPPGSMTGAPKKRSCEILGTIEPAERSIYSGVVGYLDAQGQGDWSVTIRTMFRWDDETAPAHDGETQPREVWRIGAGGAVTTLSTPEGEREEMFTKLCGPLGAFKDVA
ncbi:Aminodeoxychorismate synthase [Tolypocladium ophioglossoides CBS 100239]|uniref:aminodeoxychorismate synthase n=1 Tax=Tolypocladium ophioglossoides (strain CBS 100239) TaxID=1163406 RepID=A0A0L0NIH3_TOLOC|nr:Aminodeoxychorismate synthase [Tolypocladium ophioglossoides CBS 100239]